MLEVKAGFIKDRGKVAAWAPSAKPQSLVLLPFQLFFKLFDSVLQLGFGLLGGFQFTLQHLLFS